MSQELENIIRIELEKLGQDIGNSITDLGMSDSGASKEFEVEIGNGRARLLGVHYLKFLVDGRPPGKFPPVDKILSYVRRNSISINYNGKQLNEKQTAYLIGKGIAEMGTRIYRGEKEGIPLNDLIDTGIQSLLTQVADNAVKNVVKKLNL